MPTSYVIAPEPSGTHVTERIRGWIWEGQIDLCVHQNHVFRARPVSSELDPRYISHYTNTHGQDYFLTTGKQTTNLASVSLSNVRRCPVALSSTAEMREIVRLISESLARVQAVQATFQELVGEMSVLDSAILSKAFRGELVAQDPNDEPAPVLLERLRDENGSEPKPARGRRKPRAIEEDGA